MITNGKIYFVLLKSSRGGHILENFIFGLCGLYTYAETFQL